MKFKALALSFLFSSSVLAAAHEGHVVKMEFGPVYGDVITVDMSFDNPTACASNVNFDYSFDSGTEVGKKMYAALLAAQRSNSVITISGTGVCTVNTLGRNTEDIRWIQTK